MCYAVISVGQRFYSHFVFVVCSQVWAGTTAATAAELKWHAAVHSCGWRRDPEHAWGGGRWPTGDTADCTGGRCSARNRWEGHKIFSLTDFIFFLTKQLIWDTDTERLVRLELMFVSGVLCPNSRGRPCLLQKWIRK